MSFFFRRARGKIIVQHLLPALHSSVRWLWAASLPPYSEGNCSTCRTVLIKTVVGKPKQAAAETQPSFDQE